MRGGGRPRAAFNPLSPPSSAQPRAETIYVAFQQRVAFEVGRALDWLFLVVGRQGFGSRVRVACVGAAVRVPGGDVPPRMPHRASGGRCTACLPDWALRGGAPVRSVVRRLGKGLAVFCGIRVANWPGMLQRVYL